MVAITNLVTAAVGVLATTASATPASERAIEVRNASIKLLRTLMEYKGRNGGANLFGADKVNNVPQSWLDGMKGFGGGNCETHLEGWTKLRSGQDVPTVTVWVCWGGGWFPNYQQAQREGLEHVCPSIDSCGINDGGLWAN